MSKILKADKAALDVRFDSDAGDDLSVREYLGELLLTVWSEGEQFSGKRPFGNSDWEYDLYNPLAKAGFIDMGKPDSDGCYNPTTAQANIAGAYVSDLISLIFAKSHDRAG